MNIDPTPHAASPDAPHPAAALALRLDSILAPLLLVITAGFRILGRFAQPVWTRFSRGRLRLARLLANLAAGRLPRLRAPRPGRTGGAPAPYSPQGRLWLVRKLGYRAAGHASQLNHLLQAPETQALLATAPPAALAALGRTLRPLCRLLGVDLPPALLRAARIAGQAAGAPRPEPRKPARPRPPQPAPLLPLYPQHRPRLILYPNPPRKIRPA
ncbi:MAG: hypothetical protein IT555_09450 [Acetobacteraceae bacterium]|nr:hypothetical protein [Acetobacteraceae bacterium]